MSVNAEKSVGADSNSVAPPLMIAIGEFMPAFKNFGDTNKQRRFYSLLGEDLESKPEISVDGFIWAVERVLMSEDGDFDEFDRYNLRNGLVYGIQMLFSRAPHEFTQSLVDELWDIKSKTGNFG